MSSDAVENLRVAFVRDDSRRPIKAQLAMLKAEGVTRIYTDWSLLTRQRRKGHRDVIVVTDLWVIADPTRRTVKGGMRKSIMERMREVSRVGASILELTSNRSTLIEDDKYAMLGDALDVLANTRARSSRIGRPPREWTEDQKTIMRLHWHSRQHASNGAALAAMADDGLRVSVQQATKVLGPSGRKPGTSGPKPKPRRKRGGNR